MSFHLFFSSAAVVIIIIRRENQPCLKTVSVGGPPEKKTARFGKRQKLKESIALNRKVTRSLLVIFERRKCHW